MSSTAASELSASVLIERIAAGEYPREVILTVARGFLPLPQDDLVAVLAFIAGNEDEELRGVARTSLAEMPPRAIVDFASNEALPPDQLGYLLAATDDGAVLEALIRNRAMADAAVVALARNAEPAVQEVIVINQARILRAPEILDALLANPKLSTDVRRRALETREEFFDKKARVEERRSLVDDEEDEGPAVLDLPLDQIADLLEKARNEDIENLPPPPLLESELKDEKKKSIWSQIQAMSVAQKVMLAFRGDKTTRMILVRERNKLVCSSVMRNPRMTTAEAEAIAGMRNVDEEVLRILTTRREWMGKYTIVNNLVHNPKAPMGVVLTLINRLTLRDLKALKDDKNVPEVVRQVAKKYYVVKNQK
ncbi:MAG: hypothetical protein JWO56_1299 [Acidobacteria bacterium]|nr:hypothetical protein [Acidobacteriota bacterium]